MMSGMICLRCMRSSLPRTGFPALKPEVLGATFSTSAAVSASAPTQKGQKTLRLTRNSREKTGGKPPAPGERRAAKRRIVLNNENAIEVSDLENFTIDKLQSQNTKDGTDGIAREEESTTKLASYHNKVLGFTQETVDTLMALGVFKHTQSWDIFRRPATVVRSQTVELARKLRRAEDDRQSQGLVLTGPRGSGKSVLLLQAAAMAHVQGWAVMHIPEAKDLTNAHTSYAPHALPDGKIVYIQPHYTSQLLRRIARANEALLSNLQISQSHDLPIPIQPNMSLFRFAELGRDSELAWPIWQAFWTELLKPSNLQEEGLQRPPILFTLDDMNNIHRETAYITPEMQPIHAHDLAIVRQLNDLLLGRVKLPNGGMVVTATTDSNRPSAPTMEHILEQNSEEAELHWNPYTSIDQRVADVLKNIPTRKVTGLSIEETRGIIEYYAKCGLLGRSVSNALIGEKWTVAGGGIVGAIEKATLRAVA